MQRTSISKNISQIINFQNRKLKTISNREKKLPRYLHFTTKDSIKITKKGEINEELKNLKQMNWLCTHIYINTVPAVKHSMLAGFVLSFNNRHNFFIYKTRGFQDT